MNQDHDGRAGFFPARFSRRDFLLGTSSLAAASGLLSLGARPVSAEDIANEIRWYTWSTYYDPDWFTAFNEQTGIQEVPGFGTSNDQQFAKMKAGGSREWDLFSIENVMCPLYIKEGLVQPLDYERLVHRDKLFPSFRDAEWTKGPDGQHYFVVGVFGIDTISYRADLIPKPDSWNALFNPEYEGRITFMDYALDAINMAGMALYGREGYSAWTPEQLAEIKKKLLEQKKLVRTYWASEADARNLFLNGEVIIGETWVPTAYALQAEGIDVQLALPKEGALGWSDNLGISTDAGPAEVNAAYALINYLMSPDYGKQLNLGPPYTTSTTYGWIDELPENAQKVLFLDQIELFQTFNYRKHPPNYNEWVELWEEVKAS